MRVQGKNLFFTEKRVIRVGVESKLFVSLKTSEGGALIFMPLWGPIRPAIRSKT